MKVLLNAAIYYFCIAEMLLHNQKGMLHLAADGCLSAVFHPVIVDSLVCFCELMARGTLYDAEVHGSKMRILANLLALLDSKISGIPVRHMVILSKQFMHLADIMHIGRRSCNRMDVAASRIHPRMYFHAVVPLISLFCLMHLRISCMISVLCGAGGLDDGSIHDGSPLHHESCRGQAICHILKDLPAYIVLFEQMTELQQGGGIRHLLLAEIKAQELLHGIAVINGVLYSLIRQVEPSLHQVHAEHAFYFFGRAAAFAGRVKWGNHGNPSFPWDDGIHLLEEDFSLRYALSIVVFAL